MDREELVARLAEALQAGPPPTGRFLRLWRVAQAPAITAARLFVVALKRLSGVADGVLDEDRQRAAEGLLTSMVYLRGALFKGGQVFASVPRDAPSVFAEVFSLLAYEAPALHFALLEAVFEDDLGGRPEELFAAFAPVAAASASLGQVHRARLADGTEVAVKVQYPGMARAIAADLAALRGLLLPLRLSPYGRDVGALLDEVQAMLLYEVDYLQEARALAAAGERVADAELLVPRVYPERSGRRVLTMDWIEGVHLPGLLARDPGQEERDRRGSQMVRFVLRGMAAGLCYADPHPGNFLFLDDGRLGVVDFGACRILTPSELTFLHELESAIFGGVGDLRRAARVLAGGEPRGAAHQEFLERYLDWLWTPLRAEGPFDFGSSDHFRRGLEIAREGVRHRHLRFHSGASWFGRAILGIRSLAHRLGARIDLRRIEQEEWGRRRLSGGG